MFGVATTAILTRLLAPAEYGLYALGLSIVFFVTIGVFEWIGLSLLRLAPTARDPERFFGTLVTCFLALCGVTVLGAAVILVLGGLGQYLALTAACLPTAFAAAWFELNQRLQLADLREKEFFRASLSRGLLTCITVPLVAYLTRSASLTVLVLGLSFLVAVLPVREPRLKLYRCRFDAELCRSLLRFGVPLSVSVSLATMLMSIDKWMLQGLSGVQAVGFFSAATFVAQVPITTLAGGIGSSAYSMAVRAVEFSSRAAAARKLAQNFVVLFGIIVPAGVGVISVSENLAHVMVGPSYWRSVVVLTPLLSGVAMLSGIRGFYVDTAFQLAHKTAPLIATTAFGLILNIALDFWLIPQMAELGAAIASFVASFACLVLATVLSRRFFRLPIPYLDAVKIMSSAAIMYWFLRELDHGSGALALVAQILAGSVVYFGGLITLKVSGVREALAEVLAGAGSAEG
ncbi:MAG TPA: lipopolysaccharide biosynthesis protein [Acetobacteraceae bacterium]